MSSREQLFGYLSEVERRFRILTVARGGAWVLLVAVAATAAAVMVLLARPVGVDSVRALQFLLFLAIGLAIAWLVGMPFMTWTRRRTAGELERANPELEQRLITLAGESGGDTGNPFHELLARDAMRRAETYSPEDVVPGKRIAAFAGGGLAGAFFLAWMIFFAPAPFGPGAALLWAGSESARDSLLARVEVRPGDVTVRKGADQWITAAVRGFHAEKVLLNVRAEGRSEWDVIPMAGEGNGGTFEFLLAGISQPLDYYVVAGGVRSPQFRVKTIALPEIQKLGLTYQFPAWLAMPAVHQEGDGDVSAVDGTNVTLEIETDMPLERGLIVFDDGTEIPLASQTRTAAASFTLDEKSKRTSYYIASRESDGVIRLTEDYFIKVSPEQPPVLRIAHPGKDARVSPIEELAIQVSAEDDFGISALALHYSVNGGEERVKALPFTKGVKKAEAEALLYLEDFKLVPGDIVSYYASANDSRHTVRTDIYFAEAQPFEKNFSQSQVSAQPGQQAGDEQADIAQRQKEVIAATWNQIRTPPQGAALQETSQFLAEVQDKIRDQARALSQRMRARLLTESGEAFKRFADQMDKAADEMGRAASKLKGAKWRNSIEPEQKALQALLRAQSMFRDIQVAQQQGGGGSGGSGASRDLESLLDLELDTEKNQYETGQTAASGGQQQRRDAELEAMLRRLEELARRQQELAEQAKRDQQQAASRWRQEMLRREAEELRKDMERLAQQQSQSGQWRQESMSRNQQGGQQSQQSREGEAGEQRGDPRSQQQGQQSASQQGGQQSQRDRPQESASNRQGLDRDSQERLRRMREQGTDPRLQSALNRLEQAEREMERAGAQNGVERGRRDQAAESAARSLREAESTLRGIRGAGDEAALDQLAEKAGDLANRQRESSEKTRQAFGNAGRQTPQSMRQSRLDPAERKRAADLYDEKQKIAGEIERLQNEMQQAARRLANNQRGAADKLRQALKDTQQDELSQRMRYSAELVRRGMGSMSYLREAPVGQGLQRLQEKLMEARDSLHPGDERPADLASALRSVERLRRSAEQAAQAGQMRRAQEQSQREQQEGQGSRNPSGPEGQEGQQNQQARESGQNQRGDQPGQGGGGEQPGQERGQQAQAGQQGQDGQRGERGQGGQQGRQGERGSSQGDSQRMQLAGGSGDGAGYSAMNDGTRSIAPAVPGRDAADVRQDYQRSLRELEQLARSASDNPELAQEVREIIARMQKLDPSRFGGATLMERIEHSMLPALTELEAQLRLREMQRAGGVVRTETNARVPEGYGDAVAEYFRKLNEKFSGGK